MCLAWVSSLFVLLGRLGVEEKEGEEKEEGGSARRRRMKIKSMRLRDER